MNAINTLSKIVLAATIAALIVVGIVAFGTVSVTHAQIYAQTTSTTGTASGTGTGITGTTTNSAAGTTGTSTGLPGTGTVTPGVPNTGAGGNASNNLLLIVLTTIPIIMGTAYAVRETQKEN